MNEKHLNDMRKVLEQYIEGSSVEKLISDLNKPGREALMAVSDQDFDCSSEVLLNAPASVSFYCGVFSKVTKPFVEERFDTPALAANQELALAA